jgi:hypothetical protein
MKTNIPSTFLRFVFATGLAAAALAWADEEGTTANVKLSAPGKPATLQINMPWADIHIAGADGDTVTVVSSIDQKGKETRSDGLRRLDDQVSFELVEHDNTVTLRIAGDNPWASHDAEFKITVPRAMALDVKTEAGGDLAVKDIDGDIDISNMNGEVKLDGISGSAVVNTMNGEVHAVYAKAPQKLVSITSMNGEVDLRVPADTKANVRLRTHNGSILTDFDETVLKTKSEGRGDGYNYSYGPDAARLGADAAHMAAEATRAAMQIARDVSREVKREVERAAKEAKEAKEEAEDDAKAAADEAKADKEAAEASTMSTPTSKAIVTTGSATPVAPRAPRTPRAAHAPIPPITGGKTVSGTLNGGGVDIKVSTMNGEITLRKTK